MNALVGRPVRRLGDPRLLTGRGRFIDDLQPAGLLHAAFLRSPHAHARLGRVDTGPAAEQPAVHLAVHGRSPGAAEGGTGVWERLVADPRAFAEVAREALRVCHFSPSGEPDAEWALRCSRACYDCLLSYSNQRQHRHLNRHLLRDHLLVLASSELVVHTAARTYDEQYQWLLERTDPMSTFERAFLEHLYDHKLRLPDLTQHHPCPDVAVQPDLYYERNGLPDNA